MANKDGTNKEGRDWDVYSSGVSMQFGEELVLGPLTSFGLLNDPKHMAFVLARYKFVAKMFEGLDRVLEVGCGDAFGTPIVAQHVKNLHCVDWDERHIEGNTRRLAGLKNLTFEVHDMNLKPTPKKYQAIFWLDVLEHLEPEKERSFFKNLSDSLEPDGILITGTPSKSAEMYQSEWSRKQHINLKYAHELKEIHQRYFKNTFSFAMNDEVLHTGFPQMCHYLFAMGVGVRR